MEQDFNNSENVIFYKNNYTNFVAPLRENEIIAITKETRIFVQEERESQVKDEKVRI